MESFGPFRQLIALAETGNFRKAGERLGITHSAISQTVAKLECDYGVELFSRQRNNTIPTAFGQRIIDAAKTALGEMDQAERDVALMRNLEGGRLVVGVDPNVGESLLGPALSRLMNAHAKLKFTVKLCSWQEFDSQLQAGHIDIYVGLRPDRLGNGLVYRELKLLPPVAVCSSNHPLAGTRSLSATEIVEYPIIGGSVPDWLLEQIRSAYPDVFTSLESLRSLFLTSQDLGLLRQILLSTNTTAMIAKTLVRSELEAGALVELTLDKPIFSMSVPGVIAHVENRPLPPSASRLITEIERFLHEAWQRIG